VSACTGLVFAAASGMPNKRLVIVEKFYIQNNSKKHQFCLNTSAINLYVSKIAARFALSRYKRDSTSRHESEKREKSQK